MPPTLANPTPLGLISFGLSTILINLATAGLISNGSPILAQGIFLGGLAQLLAGILEYFKGNTFGCAVFSSFGAYWLSASFFNILPKLGWADAPDPSVMGAFMFIWGIYAVMLFLAVIKGGGILAVILTCLVLHFFLQAFGIWFNIEILKIIAGYDGIICGGGAFYLGGATIIHETSQTKILPY
ncbi:MAG: acetate uptake transporter [Deltaproteobacteria bacterium]|jgi:succinate-acetate transporter protein|nr:acetate uptake transporter [Deltaproteobacteria bacterium]